MNLNRALRRGTSSKPPEVRERITTLLGEATIAAALGERHLIDQLPPSIWRQLFSTIEQLCRLRSRQQQRDFCTSRPELIRRLLALVVLDHDAIMRVMIAKLGIS